LTYNTDTDEMMDSRVKNIKNPVKVIEQLTKVKLHTVKLKKQVNNLKKKSCHKFNSMNRTVSA
jgi:hypothetical protein